MTDSPHRPLAPTETFNTSSETGQGSSARHGRAASEILSLPPLDEPPPPRPVRPGTFGVLDIGSTKMTCLIGRADPNGLLRVQGYGWRRSRGIKNGTVVDFAEAERAIRATVGQAEEAADRRLDEVTINLSCGQPTSHLFNARMPIGGREVNESDMERVVAEGQMRAMVEGRTVIHTMPIGFMVDDTDGLVDPRGQLCEQLTARLHVVDAASNALATLTSALSRAELRVRHLVSAPFASGLATLAEDERDLGATVVDMGGGTTSIAVFKDNALQHTSFIPVGGLHVTRDLAGFLSTSLEEAERLKTKYGAAELIVEDSRDTFPVQLIGERPGSLNRVTRARLVAAIQPRIEETLELVRDRLSAAGFGHASRERVVITGGASLLEGLGPMAVRILGRPVRLGRPMHVTGLPETGANAAGFATAAGLLSWTTGANILFKDAYSPEPRTHSALRRFIQYLRG